MLYFKPLIKWWVTRELLRMDTFILAKTDLYSLGGWTFAVLWNLISFFHSCEVQNALNLPQKAFVFNVTWTHPDIQFLYSNGTHVWTSLLKWLLRGLFQVDRICSLNTLCWVQSYFGPSHVLLGQLSQIGCFVHYRGCKPLCRYYVTEYWRSDQC